MGEIYYKLGKRAWNGVIRDYRLTIVSGVIKGGITQNAVNSWIRRGKPTSLYELVI
jgi:hypothetical protein